MEHQASAEKRASIVNYVLEGQGADTSQTDEARIDRFNKQMYMDGPDGVINIKDIDDIVNQLRSKVPPFIIPQQHIDIAKNQVWRRGGKKTRRRKKSRKRKGKSRRR